MATRQDPAKVKPTAALTKKIADAMLTDAAPRQASGTFARSFGKVEALGLAKHYLTRMAGPDGTINVERLERPNNWGSRIVYNELRKHAGLTRAR